MIRIHQSLFSPHPGAAQARGASSHKLKTLAERITLIDERLELAEDRIEYTRKKKLTNYISANPVDIIQNIFGGGSVQRDNIAISKRSAAPSGRADPSGRAPQAQAQARAA